MPDVISNCRRTNPATDSDYRDTIAWLTSECGQPDCQLCKSKRRALRVIRALETATGPTRH